MPGLPESLRPGPGAPQKSPLLERPALLLNDRSMHLDRLRDDSLVVVGPSGRPPGRSRRSSTKWCPPAVALLVPTVSPMERPRPTRRWSFHHGPALCAHGPVPSDASVNDASARRRGMMCSALSRTECPREDWRVT